MTEVTRRRGRPPKATIEGHPDQPLVLGEIENIGPAPIRAIVQSRTGFSKAGEEHEIEWPLGWPVPQINDALVLDGVSTRVQWITYDLDRKAIRISVA